MRQNDGCRCAFSHAQIEELHESKRQARAAAIDRLVEQARASGGCTDRMYWTIVHDFEHAEWTTNMRQLAEVGFCPPAPEEVGELELPLVLWELIEALAGLGIYLIHTDHLDDRELYERLVVHVLREDVRDLPPDSSVHEYVDLAPPGAFGDAEPHWPGRDDEPIPRAGSRDLLLPRPSSKNN